MGSPRSQREPGDNVARFLTQGFLQLTTPSPQEVFCGLDSIDNQLNYQRGTWQIQQTAEQTPGAKTTKDLNGKQSGGWK